MKNIVLSVLLFGTSLLCQAGIVGNWTMYPCFTDLTEVAEGDHQVYFLASGALYSVNTNDDSVTTYDKSKTLSDCDIAHIGWCQPAKRLIVVYSNQNIDIIEENGNVINLSDYYSKAMTADKTVNGVNVYGNYAYLSTGFGIVKVNMKNAEISNAYNLGFRVDWVHLDDTHIYAESQTHGQYTALLTSNLLDNTSWTKTAGYTAEVKTITAEEKAMAETYKPDCPKRNNFYRMEYAHDRLYTVGGLYLRAYYQFKNLGSAQIFNGTDWDNYPDADPEEIGHYTQDISYVASDPSDADHLFIGGQTGLYEYRSGVLVNHFCSENSPILSITGTPQYSLLGGLVFDDEGNLWTVNANQILEYTKDGEWKVVVSSLTDYKNLVDPIIDSRGIFWVGQHRWENYALIGYNTKTGNLTTYNSFYNEDNADMTAVVTSVAEDKDGNLWVGTILGPFYLPSAYVESGDVSQFIQVKVPRNDGTNLADYLLTDINISCIAIDGGNRKWFGTSGNGVYVIDSDNTTEVHHFTQSNSNLLSNNINYIAIDNKSGEVYIATDKGLCSYTSDATEEGEDTSDGEAYAYPNPVTPDYTGLIVVKGLAYQSEVKIVTTDGSLVAEGTSNGGTFTWDGCDTKGKKVVSGVYIVQSSTESGKSGNVCKIAIVR